MGKHKIVDDDFSAQESFFRFLKKELKLSEEEIKEHMPTENEGRKPKPEWLHTLFPSPRSPLINQPGLLDPFREEIKNFLSDGNELEVKIKLNLPKDEYSLDRDSESEEESLEQNKRRRLR